MKLAKVLGNVVASEKHPSLIGVKLLIIQPHDHDGVPDGEPIVAADPMQAGPGDTVAFVVGREASLHLPVPFTPVDAGIVAIVDHYWGDSAAAGVTR
jgi:ethanolamine utilization protein EutN